MYIANVRINTIYCTLNIYKMYSIYKYNIHYMRYCVQIQYKGEQIVTLH